MSTSSWTTSNSEQGAGVVGTLLGVGVFLALMLFAVQVLFGLYVTSVVTAVAYDAAKSVAGADRGNTPAARGDAVRNAEHQLGHYADDVTFDWRRSDDDVVRLEVRAKRPVLLPRSLLGGVGLGDIEREVQVRVEKPR